MTCIDVSRTQKIPELIYKAVNFQKTWFMKSFIPALLTPPVTPDDNRSNFINALAAGMWHDVTCIAMHIGDWHMSSENLLSSEQVMMYREAAKNMSTHPSFRHKLIHSTYHTSSRQLNDCMYRGGNSKCREQWTAADDEWAVSLTPRSPLQNHSQSKYHSLHSRHAMSCHVMSRLT